MTAPRPRVEGEAMEELSEARVLRFIEDGSVHSSTFHRDAMFIAQELLDRREEVSSLTGQNARLTAEVERLKWEAVVWKSSLECWGRHHPWCWMVTQAGVEGVYCNCGYKEALTGKDRSHEVTPLSPHDAEQVRLFEERIRASITPESEEAHRRFIEARDAFAASGDALPTPAPETTNDGK